MATESQRWVLPTLLLCANGFFRSVNLAQPYLTPYLMGPHKNLTSTQLVNMVYPVWIYSYLLFLVPVFLLTDFLKYKPVILMQGISLIGCWILLLFGQGVSVMQVMQVVFGLASAADIGYYSYIYSIVEKDMYQKVTSYTRAVVLVGLFFGGVLAQMLVSFANMDYFYLNVITLSNMSISFLISIFLPVPKKTLFFYSTSKKNDADISLNDNTDELVPSDAADNADDKTSVKNMPMENNELPLAGSGWKLVVLSLLRDLKIIYSNLVLLRWSLWWVLSFCGYMLVVNYIQNLWESVYSSIENDGQVYNGAVESAATLLGAFVAFSVGFIKVDWTLWGELVLGSCSILKCLLLFLMFWTNNIWICYAAFLAYIFLYNFVMTVTQFQLAVGMNNERFALVFGANTFMAVALNALLTVIVVDDIGFGLDVETLFIVCSVYFGILAAIFLSHWVYSFCEKFCRRKDLIAVGGNDDETTL